MYTLEQMNSLQNAIAKGVRRVRYSVGPGQVNEVEYASLSEMRALLSEMQKQLFPSSQSKKASFVRYDRRI